MNQRLNEIVTNWEELFSAYASQGDASEGNGPSPIVARVLQRYSVAVWNYLACSVKDNHVADDLSQEFAVRFLRGDYRNLHPERGRFRDFLKVTLRNMVIDHFRRQKRLPAELELHVGCDPCDSSMDLFDELFIEHWRQDLLRRAWETFKVSGNRRGALYYEALCLHAESGAISSEELADRLSGICGESVTAASARQTLHRARQMFADCLREEVRQSLSADDVCNDAVEEELHDLRLTRYLSSFPAARSPK